MQIDFSQNELQELRTLVSTRCGELHQEIHHATLSHFRDALKARRANLRALLAKIDASLHEPAPPLVESAHH